MHSRQGPPLARHLHAGPLSYLLKPEGATIFSAVIAVTSVALSVVGSLLTEARKAELKKQVGLYLEGVGRSPHSRVMASACMGG